jgi:hypothetical protein
MRIARVILGAATLWLGSCLLALPAHAIDLTGLWASDADACNKIFVTKGKSASFSKNSELQARGFIIDGKKIRSPRATCTITRSKETGDVVSMVASCANDIMYSDMQFSLKVLGDGKVSRIFPEFAEAEMAFIYYRCPSQAK